MQKRIVEMTGDTTPDAMAIKKANVLITTPEKWVCFTSLLALFPIRC